MTEPLLDLKDHKRWPLGDRLLIFEDRVEYHHLGLFGGKETKVLRYDDIRSVNVRKGVTPWNAARVEITGGGFAGIVVDHTSNAEAEQAASLIADFQSRANATASKPANDIPAQIQSLAELRDNGVITNQEFEEKKAELLARM